MDDDGYFVVATVDAGGEQRSIMCNKRPSAQEINLLYTLGEHVSRIMSVDDVCHRMKISVNAMRIIACKLRKKLHYDWTVDAVSNKGLRLCYIGSPLSEADRTVVEFDPAAIKRTRVQSRETREKIRQTQIRKQAHQYFSRGRISSA